MADYAKQYWDLANYIVGFASVQQIAFLLTLGSQQVFRANILAAWWWVVSMETLFFVAYCAGVSLSYLVEAQFLPSWPDPMHTGAYRTMIARLVWLSILFVLGIGALIGLDSGERAAGAE